MTATPFNWTNFQTRMKDIDKDFRQMALFDLEQYLNKDNSVIGESDQNGVLVSIYQCFSEKERHSEVHSNAVRVLGPLIRKLADRNQEQLVQRLADIVCTSNPPGTMTSTEVAVLRENASMGLKVIAESLVNNKDRSNEDVAKTSKTAQAAAARLTQGLGANIDAKVKADVYDVLGDLIDGYGKHLVDLHARLQEFALRDISNDSTADGPTRKKAAAALSKLSVFTSDDLFAAVLQFVTDGLQSAKRDKLRQYVQLVNSLSRSAASRFGSSVETIVSLFLTELNRLNQLSADEKESPESDGTREQIFQCLESFVNRCSGFMNRFLPHLIQACLQHVAWDPNFCDDFEGGGPEQVDDDAEEDEIFEDDSDVSWKVRKASARCLSELFRSRDDLLAQNIQKIIIDGKLYLRFRERVEQVRVEVLDVFTAALQKCKVNLSTFDKSASATAVPGSFAGGSFRTVVDHRPEASLFVGIKDDVMRQLLATCANNKSPQIKLAGFVIIRDLFVLLGTSLASCIPACADSVRSGLSLSNTQKTLPQLRAEIVTVGRLLCATAAKSETPQQLIAVVEALAPSILQAAQDRNFKTVIAALNATDELVNVALMSPNSAVLAKQIFEAVSGRLRTADADQEVKRAATQAMSSILVQLEGPLQPIAADVGATHELLLQLTRNETTRIVAVQCFVSILRTRIAESVLLGLTTELVSFLRKTDRTVREVAVRALTKLVHVNGLTVQKNKQAIDGIIAELGNDNATLLSDKELFLSAISLELAAALVSIAGAAAQLLNTVVPATLRLLTSPLSQGLVLSNAGVFLRQLSTSNAVNYNDLLAKVTAAAKGTGSTTATNVAVAVGAVVAADSDDARRKKSVASFVGGQKGLGVCCLGEIGHAGCILPKDARDFIMSGMLDTSEDVRSASIRALGRAASAKVNADIIDIIAVGISTSPAQAYYFFRAIKEAITSSSKQDLLTSVADAAVRSKIQALLLQSSNREDDNLVDIIGECIGRLAPFNFGIMDDLAASLRTASSQVVQATIICGVKYAVSGIHSNGDEAAVARQLPVFLSLLQRTATVTLRRSVLQLLSTVASSRPRLLLNDFAKTTAVPALIAELAVDTTLVSEIDLGPFKHRVDKGAEMRKIAFETLVTLVDGLFKSNSVLEASGHIDSVVERVVLSLAVNAENKLLAEHESDIHNQCRAMLAKLQRYAPAQPRVVATLPQIVRLLQAALGAKAKDPQEQEKVADSIKYAIHCIVKLKALGSVPAEQVKSFNELIKMAEAHEKFKDAMSMTD